MDAKPSHVEVDMDDPTFHLHHHMDCGRQTWEQSPLTGVITSHHAAVGGVV
jgi:hypothetical protein